MGNNELRFWKVTNEPYPDEIRYVDGWYWHDADCAEPMGPFGTRAEAIADHIAYELQRLRAALIECRRLADESKDDHESSQHKWLASIYSEANSAIAGERERRRVDAAPRYENPARPRIGETCESDKGVEP
jgi:hypothetical protein